MFDTQLGFAIRRHCAPLLDAEPFCSPDEYIEARSALSADEVGRRLLRPSGFETLLIETGHRGDEILGPAHMGATANAGYAEVVRLEVLAEELVEAGVHPSGFVDEYARVLDERLRTAVGAKTIAAYRTGLDFDPSRPTHADVARAVGAWIDRISNYPGSIRLEDPVIIRHLIWSAIDRAVPIQFHVGYGDPDVDLHRCNPLLLTDLLRATRGSGSDILLLHCYPFHREAGYLAHCFEHVYCDVGLAINYTGSQSAQIIAESLELTPFHKALFSSDAWGAAELYHLGALLFRRGLAEALDDWARRDQWPIAEQQRVAQMISRDNARRVYRLDQLPSATLPSSTAHPSTPSTHGASD
ncbi:amidohydrolase family protein [Helcobacillus massiliensis]|uniref:Amidohydrolase-related domain-containing protein n=1 Tax=Helcobacillus massiliensis TaxID=521392 RepID=A0A839QS57_9MICO|nr:MULTISPECIES: amidohydrolase family protein [Helcobacillus]MBB3023323.1 hypothetical protein [Helcobacillus massiliensis]MCG7426695.1 amidohydrolase family protein [Helcobacillus sp. ACRRO]MCT1557656.1 amidohydrolase family protein [Helcobacillus massiliensis]MCT2035928.1 amidohydrolase family protein [Helcobacillus massiliensis]MCT2331802.1 amidohydrolase family protein [Helcobacillus massiliensis]